MRTELINKVKSALEYKSAREIATEIGITESCLSRLLNDKRGGRMSTFEAILLWSPKRKK